MTAITLGSSSPVARVQHVCQECWRAIQPGERYHRQRNIGDDGPYVWKACEQCHSLLRDLWALDFRGEDDWCYPYLPDMDWPDVTALGEVWVHRVALWRRKWRRRGQVVAYPTAQAVAA